LLIKAIILIAEAPRRSVHRNCNFTQKSAMAAELWNERYRNEEYIYGKEPNLFFREQLLKLQPGNLLLPAEGEGRNAVFAASLGWDVTAYDQSDEAMKKAMRLAHENKVAFRYTLGDLGTVTFPDAMFDAVALIFVHQKFPERRMFHQQLRKFMKPGGTLILEAYSKEQLRFQTGGPKDQELLFDLEEIREDFAGWNIIQLEQTEVVHQEGLLHRGQGSVIRLVATA
jgi:SAM-dependent methyltransferase